MIVALAIPPPSHIVCSPYRPPRCSSAFTSVVMMRASWLIAIAPPLTLVFGHVSARVGGPGQCRLDGAYC
jgi:hypothetical protein